MKWFLVLMFVVFIKRGETIRCDQPPLPGSMEAKLKYDILCKYDRSLSPTINKYNQTKVRVFMSIMDFDFDEQLQTLDLNVRLMVTWIDFRLIWKIEDYDNIKYLREDSTEIWIPNLSASNGDGTHMDDVCKKRNCAVRSNGRVYCALPCSYKMYCNMNFKNWPYDRHNCSLNVQADIDIMFNSSNVLHRYYKIHNQWNLLYSNGRAINMTFGNLTYSSLRNYFIIERHANFEVALILWPSFILLAINLIGLWLEPGCFERLIITISNLILHFLLVQQIAWYVPKNGEDIPNIVIFNRDSLILTGVLLLETIITRSIVRFQISIPNWINFFINLVSNSPVEKYFASDNLNEVVNPLHGDSSTNDSSTLIEANQSNKMENSKWKLFAKFIDRLLFLIYVLVYIIMLIALVPVSEAEIPK